MLITGLGRDYFKRLKKQKNQPEYDTNPEFCKARINLMVPNFTITTARDFSVLS